MTETNLPAPLAVQLSAEVGARARVNLVGDRAIVMLGGALALIGDPGVVHELVLDVDRQLTILRDGRP